MIDRKATVRAPVRQFERLNAFWQDHTLTGDVHRSFTRIFHADGASAEGYGWDGYSCTRTRAFTKCARNGLGEAVPSSSTRKAE